MLLRAKTRQKATPAYRGVERVNTYIRDPYVAEYSKRQAKGICQLCDATAPFKTRDGEHYLESHHIDWLAHGGEDTIENTCALCPNCHRKMHILDLISDVVHLKNKNTKQ